MLYNLFENRDFVSVFAVALLAEGVDRNQILAYARNGSEVALLAEGVDRNHCVVDLIQHCQVALLAEGVDRNTELWGMGHVVIASPSSRRAWIEMLS